MSKWDGNATTVGDAFVFVGLNTTGLWLCSLEKTVSRLPIYKKFRIQN